MLNSCAENRELQTESQKNSPRFNRSQIERTVARLESFGHRGSGTKEELLASNWVKQQLEELGLSTETQTFKCSNSYAKRILLHLFIGVVGLATLAWSPFLSLIISFLVLISFVLETSGIPVGLSRMLPQSASQNVTGRIPASNETKRRIVVCAHIDSQQTGWIWNSRLLKFFTTTFGWLPGPLKAPLFAVTATLVVQVTAALLHSSGIRIDNPALYLLLAPVYLLSIMLVGQWAFGAFVPGANDNATGVASALALAERWNPDEHENSELLVLITGCEEPGLLGAANWADRSQKLLSATPTYFVNLDLLGSRDVHFLSSECALNGWIVPYPQSMLDICHSVAEQLELPFPNPHTIPTHTDGLVFLLKNIAGVTVTSSGKGMYVPNYHTMNDRIENVNFATVEAATEFAWQVMMQLDPETNYEPKTLDQPLPNTKTTIVPTSC